MINFDLKSNEYPPYPSCQNPTRKINDAAKLMTINVIDNLIVSEGDKYYSFSDEGML